MHGKNGTRWISCRVFKRLVVNYPAIIRNPEDTISFRKQVLRSVIVLKGIKPFRLNPVSRVVVPNIPHRIIEVNPRVRNLFERALNRGALKNPVVLNRAFFINWIITDRQRGLSSIFR